MHFQNLISFTPTLLGYHVGHILLFVVLSHLCNSSVWSYLLTLNPTVTTASVSSPGGKCPFRHLTGLFTTSIHKPIVSAPYYPPSTSTVLERPVSDSITKTKSMDTAGVHKVQPLPWTLSISETATLSYLPMLQKELEVIQSLGMEAVKLEERFVSQSSSMKPARIGNLYFRNKQFRKVRLTYFDGGDNVQVFNSVWYPSFEYDLPMLGVDLISLGKSRVLNVIDFQPLHPTEEYSHRYIDPLTEVRNKYPDLHGVLSGKIYDDTSFFSKNMLFGRFTDVSKIEPVVRPAHEEYLDAYVSLMKDAVPNHSKESKEIVRDRQTQYDKYSALKDPAIGLFDSYFGKEWSHDFVHKFLFELSLDPINQNSINASSPVHQFSFDDRGQIKTTRLPYHS